MKLTLSKPLMIGGRHVSELDLRQPVAGDLRRLPADGGTTMGDLLDIVARLAGLPPEVVDELEPADALRAIELLNPFFAPPPTTGPTS